MCVTCGCGDGTTTVALPGDDLKHSPAPEEMHTHADGTAHAHGNDHAHPHEHGHAHDSDHEHDHPHDHAHDHPHAHDLAVPGRDAKTIALETALLGKNQVLAERNRGWLSGRGVLALNLMSSPGAGKTTLLERCIRDLRADIDINVIEGDQATAYDAQRIRAAGAVAVQVNTGTGCHLEADMLERALRLLKPATGSLLVIENVGNLVCPALFDLGEKARVVVFSVTEGEDKPLKYPHMFSSADVLLLSKTDLLPHLRVNLQLMMDNALAVKPGLKIFPVSAYTGKGLDAWYDWLRGELAAMTVLA